MSPAGTGWQRMSGETSPKKRAKQGFSNLGEKQWWCPAFQRWGIAPGLQLLKSMGRFENSYSLRLAKILLRIDGQICPRIALSRM
jgi:hypothetical protein